jgi:hypothetical protein
MRPMTPHEKECALAAIAVRIEAAKTVSERKEWKKFLHEIISAPLELP